MILVPLGGLICWVIGLAFGLDFETRSEARCKANLAAIGSAMHEYHAKYGHFPPAFLTDTNGTPTQSWRVLLLEFLDPALFRSVNLSEPWDGPNNRKIASRMPDVYACPSRHGSRVETRTSYVVIIGPETAFPGSKTVKITDIRPPSNGIPVILVAEIANVDIPWMQPTDLRSTEMSFAINDPLKPSISSTDQRGAGVIMVEGKSGRFKTTYSATQIKNFVDISKGVFMPCLSF